MSLGAGRSSVRRRREGESAGPQPSPGPRRGLGARRVGRDRGPGGDEPRVSTRERSQRVERRGPGRGIVGSSRGAGGTRSGRGRAAPGPGSRRSRPGPPARPAPSPCSASQMPSGSPSNPSARSWIDPSSSSASFNSCQRSRRAGYPSSIPWPSSSARASQARSGDRSSCATTASASSRSSSGVGCASIRRSIGSASPPCRSPRRPRTAVDAAIGREPADQQVQLLGTSAIGPLGMVAECIEVAPRGSSNARDGAVDRGRASP